MRRFNSGEWMLMAAIAVLFVGAVGTLVWLTWTARP